MDSVVKIVVESLMKVSTKCWASGGVFAIFELPDGTRCWAGQHRLKSQFLTAGIFSRDTDKGEIDVLAQDFWIIFRSHFSGHFKAWD